MKTNKQIFNSLLVRYKKYLRKRNNLKLNNKNLRRQHILTKHIDRLFEKLMSLKISILKGTAITAVTLGTLAISPQVINAQNFAPPQTNPFSLTNGISELSFGDLDGDGDLDIMASTNTSFFYCENTGSQTSPNYAAQITNPFSLTFPDPTGGCAPTLVDLDKDGDLDLMSGSRSGNFYYYENIGTANSPNYGPAQPNPFSLIAGASSATAFFNDLDGDGDLDLLGGTGSGDFQYFENIGSVGNPNFGALQTNTFGLANLGYYVTGSVNLNLIDMDNDGDYDLLSGNYAGDFIYFENIGTTSIPAFGAIQTNPFSITKSLNYSVSAVADIDGDGDFDLMASNQSRNFIYFENTATNPPIAPTNKTTLLNSTICDGETAQLSASASAIGTISWYDAATGGNFLGSGSSFTTPALNANTTFYAQDITVSGASIRTAILVTVISTIDKSTTASSNTIKVGQTGATYQWLDCNDNNTAISGETNQNYTANMSGDYAVEVTLGNCVDTSNCVNIVVTGINELDLSNIKTYPNPVNNIFTIELNETSINTKISVFSIDGKLVYNQSNVKNNKIVIDTDSWNNGIYIVRLSNEKSNKTVRLIK